MSPTAAGVVEVAEVAGVAVALVGAAGAAGVAAAVRPPSLARKHSSVAWR